MGIIDLSQPLFDRMPVYPGDPEVKITQIHALEKEGWRLRYLQFSSHIGTHADAFAHMDETGQTIDNISIEKFIGKAILLKLNNNFPVNIGLAFKEGELALDLLDKIKNAKPKFVIVGNEAILDVELERALLKAEILTITDLVNMEKLPVGKQFMFYGVPLNIKGGDGSPIRAFAIVD